MKQKKLYLVKREVYARNIKEALTNKGVVYEVQSVNEQYQPEQKAEVGFSNNNKK